MFSHFKDSTYNVFSSIGSSLSWILKNKKSIAIFALMMISETANAEVNRRIVFHFGCGSFELKKADEISKIAGAIGTPFSFEAEFDDEEGMKQCFTTRSVETFFCEPPSSYNKKDLLQITAKSDDTCAIFRDLYSKGTIKNPSKFFTTMAQLKELENNIYTPGSFRNNSSSS